MFAYINTRNIIRRISLQDTYVKVIKLLLMIYLQLSRLIAYEKRGILP
jgi:hypothetical protein